MTLDTSLMLAVNSKLQYQRTPLHVEALSKFDTLRDQVVSTYMVHLNRVNLSSVTYFFLVKYWSNQKYVMRCVMSNPHKLKVRRYSVCIIYPNE